MTWLRVVGGRAERRNLTATRAGRVLSAFLPLRLVARSGNLHHPCGNLPTGAIMSGRTLGRLLGSLLVLAAIAGAFGILPGTSSAQLADIVWTMDAPR